MRVLALTRVSINSTPHHTLYPFLAENSLHFPHPNLANSLPRAPSPQNGPLLLRTKRAERAQVHAPQLHAQQDRRKALVRLLHVPDLRGLPEAPLEGLEEDMRALPEEKPDPNRRLLSPVRRRNRDLRSVVESDRNLLLSGSWGLRLRLRALSGLSFLPTCPTYLPTLLLSFSLPPLASGYRLPLAQEAQEGARGRSHADGDAPEDQLARARPVHDLWGEEEVHFQADHVRDDRERCSLQNRPVPRVFDLRAHLDSDLARESALHRLVVDEERSVAEGPEVGEGRRVARDR